MQTPDTPKRPSIDEYFINMAKLVAQRSTCLRRQVGCVLVNSKNQVLSTGYNGSPKRKNHCDKLPCVRMEKGLEYCMAVHAEQNALLQCQDVYDIATAYITCSPCVTCTKMLLNTGCKSIIYVEDYNSQDTQARDLWLYDIGWQEHNEGMKVHTERKWRRYE